MKKIVFLFSPQKYDPQSIYTQNKMYSVFVNWGILKRFKSKKVTNAFVKKLEGIFREFVHELNFICSDVYSLYRDNYFYIYNTDMYIQEFIVFEKHLNLIFINHKEIFYMLHQYTIAYSAIETILHNIDQLSIKYNLHAQRKKIRYYLIRLKNISPENLDEKLNNM